MRKPRDYDAELKALNDKARRLREQKLRQLGELAAASGADALSIEQLAGALFLAAETKDAAIKEGWRKRGAVFFQRARTAGGSTGEQSNRAMLRRLVAARHRRQSRIARNDTRAGGVKRRERTRQLIELGGLIAKAGLIELTEDDRAVIFGLLVEAAATLRSEGGDDARLLWARRGNRAFALAEDAGPAA